MFELENIEDLASKLDILIKDKKLRTKLGENGQKRAEKECTPDQYFKKLLLFYQEILQQNK